MLHRRKRLPAPKRRESLWKTRRTTIRYLLYKRQVRGRLYPVSDHGKPAYRRTGLMGHVAGKPAVFRYPPLISDDLCQVPVGNGHDPDGALGIRGRAGDCHDVSADITGLERACLSFAWVYPAQNGAAGSGDPPVQHGANGLRTAFRWGKQQANAAVAGGRRPPCIWWAAPDGFSA